MSVREKILVFEDTNEDFNSLEGYLRAGNYQVVRAVTPEEFYGHAPYADFAAVLIDYFFRGNREAVALPLTQSVHEKNPSLAVILMSRRRPPRHEMAQCFRAGAADYFDKDPYLKDVCMIIERARSHQILSEEDLFEQEFPLPMAFLYRDFRGSRATSRTRLERLVELFEVTLKSVTYSLLAANGPRLDKALPEEVRNGLIRPSLGHFLRVITSLPVPNNCLTDLYKMTKRGKFRNLCSDFINLRNEHVGHGILQSNAVYEKLLEEFTPKLKELFKMLIMFRNYKWICVDSASMVEDKNEYIVKVFRGANPFSVFEQVTTRADLRLASKRVYLVNDEMSESILLFPWVQYTICDVCLTDKLFLYRLCREGEVWLLDHVDGHTKRTNEGWHEVVSAVDFVAGNRDKDDNK